MKAQPVTTLAGPLVCPNRRRVMPVEILANAASESVRIIAQEEKGRKGMPATIKRLPPAKSASQPRFSFFSRKKTGTPEQECCGPDHAHQVHRQQHSVISPQNAYLKDGSQTVK